MLAGISAFLAWGVWLLSVGGGVLVDEFDGLTLGWCGQAVRSKIAVVPVVPVVPVARSVGVGPGHAWAAAVESHKGPNRQVTLRANAVDAPGKEGTSAEAAARISNGSFQTADLSAPRAVRRGARCPQGCRWRLPGDRCACPRNCFAPDRSPECLE